jgi:hypothetical protein
MLMTEIRKQSLGVVDTVNDGILALAAKASDILGYSVLQEKTGKPIIELTELQLALKELDIDILVPVDVLAYQKDRQIEQTKANLEAWLKEFAIADKLARYVRFDGPAWTVDKIAEYKEPIPEFVLAKAVQIKERFPECELFVESLSDHPDPFLVVAIPHEKPYYPDKERYYVEVWAEPKFEGRIS